MAGDVHNYLGEERDSASFALMLSLTLAVASAILTVVATVAPWWVTSIVTPVLLVMAIWPAIKYGRRAASYIERVYTRYNKKVQHETSASSENRKPISRDAFLYACIVASISLVIGVVVGANLAPLFRSSSSRSGVSSPGFQVTQTSVNMPQSCFGNGPVVLAVSGRQDSPAPSLTSRMASAVGTAILERSAIGIVNVDGRPQLVYANVFPFSVSRINIGCKSIVLRSPM